jgi:hypothetical protein
MLLIGLPAIAVAACSLAPLQPVNEATRSRDQGPAPTTTMVSLPPRPRELPLDGTDPCKILSAPVRTQLSLDTKPQPYRDEHFAESKACSMRGSNSATVARIALVTTMGVDVWLDSTAQVETQQVRIAGFPALVVRTPGIEDACNVEVDLASGQFLDVLFRDGGNNPPTKQDTLCAGAQRIAEAAVTALAAKHR